MAHEGLLQEILQSPYGQSIVKQLVDTMQKLIADLKVITYNHIHSVIASFEEASIIATPPQVDMVDGVPSISASIELSTAALHRDSMRPDLYPMGVDNIVILLARGYHARHAVRGVWHDAECLSRPNRPANDFIGRAVEDFKTKHSTDLKRLGLEVIVAEKYKPMS